MQGAREKKQHNNSSHSYVRALMVVALILLVFIFAAYATCMYIALTHIDVYIYIYVCTGSSKGSLFIVSLLLASLPSMVALTCKLFIGSIPPSHSVTDVMNDLRAYGCQPKRIKLTSRERQDPPLPCYKAVSPACPSGHLLTLVRLARNDFPTCLFSQMHVE